MNARIFLNTGILIQMHKLFWMLYVLCLLTACGGGGGGGGGGGSSGTSSGTNPAPPNTPAPIVPPPSVTLAACPTSNSNMATAGGIQLSIGASRVSGVAPLAVFFDASNTTATATTRPFHELEYRWNFGDTSSGTWTYGAKAGVANRNQAMGPVAAHVFESAGTFPVTVSAFDGNTTVNYACNITVTATDTEFVGNKTVCVSTAGNFVGCPTGAVLVTANDATTAVTANLGTGNKRFLFRRGETFNVSGRILIDIAGPGIIGAFGVGAKPILVNAAAGNIIQLSQITTPNIADWRIMDLELDGGGFVDDRNVLIVAGGSINNTLILRNDFKNHQNSVAFSGSALDAINNSGFTSPMWDGLFIVDNNSTQLVGAQSANGFYVGAWRMAFMGNHIDNGWAGEHGVRSPYSDRSVWQHNTTERIARAHMTLRSANQGGSTLTAQLGNGIYYTQKLVASDNYFIGGPALGWSTNGNAFGGTGPTNDSSNGRAREQIWERNLMLMGSGTLSAISITGSQVTVRNNIVLSAEGARSPFAVVPYASPYAANNAIPQPTDVWFYHNTMYSATIQDWDVSAFVGDPFDAGTVLTYKNNLFYVPNNAANQYQDWISDMVGVPAFDRAPITCNTLIAEMQTSPNFTTNPPTTAAHVKPLTGSYAIGRGTPLPVWSDYFGNTLPQGVRDLGAVKH